MNKRWVIAQANPADAAALAGALSLPAGLAQALLNRGLGDAEAARRFLHPQLRQLADPFALPDMAAAVARVAAALERRERIVIYGDYDVDGVTASALLTRVLRGLGGDVANFLPHRLDEGYGLSADGVARCVKEHRPRLLLAVDCGTSSVREIAALKEQGVDTVVLDHHEPPSELPACVALVNPKRGAGEPFASVGVAFKLAHALLKSNGKRDLDLREHLDLVALGTVADVVPLVGENRILVKAGLDRLGRTGKAGLRALMEVAGVPDEVAPHHIGFRLGPRLNAAGRLADAMAALELLLTEDDGRARELAQLLHEHNAVRQKIEEQIVAEALAQARELAGERVLVLANPAWHVGVIGIVASRVAQEFYRPTVVIGADGKGSCRSVAGFNIVAALTACAPLLERFGGHEMAAGLSVKAENIPALRRELNAQLATLPVATLRVDAVVGLADLDEEFLAGLERFEPCGAGNPTPVFAVTGVGLRGTPQRLKDKHWKFSVTDGETTVGAIWFQADAAGLPAGGMDVAFVPVVNEFRGVTTVQLQVKDVRGVVEREDDGRCSGRG